VGIESGTEPRRDGGRASRPILKHVVSRKRFAATDVSGPIFKRCLVMMRVTGANAISIFLIVIRILDDMVLVIRACKVLINKHKIYVMKARTFIVLIALTLSILSPVSLNLSLAATGTFLATFNVCNAGGHCLSASSHSAGICEYPTLARLFEVTSSVPDFKRPSKPFLIAFQKDRPPQV
jgi:hypothetical protein